MNGSMVRYPFLFGRVGGCDIHIESRRRRPGQRIDNVAAFALPGLKGFLGELFRGDSFVLRFVAVNEIGEYTSAHTHQYRTNESCIAFHMRLTKEYSNDDVASFDGGCLSAVRPGFCRSRLTIYGSTVIWLFTSRA